MTKDETGFEQRQIRVSDTVVIEFQHVKRKEKVVGRGVWLMQGTSDAPTEFYIPEFELDAHIAALKEAKAICDEDKKARTKHEPKLKHVLNAYSAALDEKRRSGQVDEIRAEEALLSLLFEHKRKICETLPTVDAGFHKGFRQMCGDVVNVGVDGAIWSLIHAAPIFRETVNKLTERKDG